MAFTLWLSAEEEHLLSQVMRAEGSRTKQQAIISALKDKASTLQEEAPLTVRGETASISGS
jgi:hypothetical protein